MATVGLNTHERTSLSRTLPLVVQVGALESDPVFLVLMSKAERALHRPLYWGAIHPWDCHDHTYLLVDQDTQVGPGFEVICTPGHAPGQIALMVNLPSGWVLLTSDAISRPAEIEEKFAGSWDEAAAIASADKLMSLAKDRDAFVIYGHCPQQWATLKKAPEGYH